MPRLEVPREPPFSGAHAASNNAEAREKQERDDDEETAGRFGCANRCELRG